jgi:hypothetical protein
VIHLDVRADIRRAQRFYTNLKRRAVPSAASRAINDVLVTLRAEGAREIKKQHPAMKIGDIKTAIKKDDANRHTLRGSVYTKGDPLSLLMFRPSGGNRSFRFRKTGVEGIYNVTRAARARPVTAVIGTKRSVMQIKGRKAFRIPAFGNEIFVRKHPSGRQVRKLRGPSLPGVFRAQYSYFNALAMRRWAIAFRSRMAYEIERAKRR